MGKIESEPTSSRSWRRSLAGDPRLSRSAAVRHPTVVTLSVALLAVVGMAPAQAVTSATALSPVALDSLALAGQHGTAALVRTEAVAGYAGTPGSTYRRGSQTIGYSVAGRRITLVVVGSPTAAKRAVFIGAIHGNERGGVPITRALAASRPPAGVAYFVITYPNPDGAARHTRQNRRGVDLNRNFPGWVRGTRGSVTYPGTGPLSEPESKVMYTAIRKIKPTLFVTYHQHMNLVDYCGGNKTVQARYARATRLRLTQLTRNRGSQATWLHAVYRRTTIMTVELPSRVPSAMVSRHVSAAKYLAAHH